MRPPFISSWPLWPQCPKSSPTCLLPFQMFWSFQSRRQTPPLPCSPPVLDFSIRWIYVPFAVFDTCMHGAMAFSPRALSFSLGPSFRTKFLFNSSLIHLPRKTLVDRITVGLMETPEWIRSYPLESWSVEIQRFYEKELNFKQMTFEMDSEIT